jgi:photosystem II stability/assembly factor-like uncharacterized protein
MVRRLGSRNPLAAPLMLVMLAALVATLRAGAAAAQPSPATWTPLGPYGGPIQVLAADPFDPLTLYAGTRFARIFKTVDGGVSWTTARRGLARADTWIQGLSADPRRPGVLWAGDFRGQIFSSQDHAASWALDPRGVLGAPVRALHVLRASGAVLAATDGGIFRREPRSDRWSQVSKRAAWALDEDVSGIVYAASGDGILRSRDQGASWVLRLVPGGGADAVAALRDRHLLAATPAGLFESRNGGSSWPRLPALPRYVTTLARARDGKVYAGTFEGIYRSPDGHAPWTLTAQQPDDPSATALALSADGSTLYVGTFAQVRPGGVFRSPDGGTSWSAADRGLDGQPVTAVGAAEGDPMRLFLGIDGGLLESSNGGVDWQPAATGFADSNFVSSIAVDPFDPANVLVAARNGILRTTDGLHWTLAGKFASTIVFDPRVAHTAWANQLAPTAHFLGFLRSPDAGATWESIASPLAEDDVLHSLAVAADGALFASGFVGNLPFQPFEARIFRVSGNNVTRVDADFAGASRASAIAADLEDANVLYVLVDGAVFKTTDGASHWSRLAVPDPGLALSLVLVPTASGARLVVAFGSPGTPSRILASVDGGLTWSPLPSPAGADTRDLRLSLASAGGRLYAFPTTGAHVLEAFP